METFNGIMYTCTNTGSTDEDYKVMLGKLFNVRHYHILPPSHHLHTTTGTPALSLLEKPMKNSRCESTHEPGRRQIPSTGQRSRSAPEPAP